MVVLIFSLFLIVVKFVETYQQCSCDGSTKCCYGGNCEFFDGTMQECLCWINEEADFANATSLTFYYLGQMEWSQGFCYWCANGYSNYNEDEEIEDEKAGIAQKCSCKGDYWCSCEYPVYMNQCFCPGGCGSYFEDYDMCVTECQDYFKEANLTDPGCSISYMEQTIVSSGECECWCPVDPCKISGCTGGIYSD